VGHRGPGDVSPMLQVRSVTFAVPAQVSSTARYGVAG
jgi:hypothetical protein